MKASITMPIAVKTLWERMHNAGYELYAVGGCVRDSLLGIPPHDWDFCTNALPEEISRVFSDCRQIETGRQHGTMTILWAGKPCEITTYRRESSYTDHRRPDAVMFTEHLAEDLCRRDFTVNAMACAPDTGLVDLYGGQADLQQGIIRCVGDANIRFQEDALRILRAMRFCATYGWTADESTAKAIHEEKALLRFVSAERILSELRRMLMGKAAACVMMEYRDVLIQLMPELSNRENWWQQITSVLQQQADEAVRWAILLSGCTSEEQILTIQQRLRMMNALSKPVLELYHWHKIYAEKTLEAMPTVFEARQWLSVAGETQSLRFCWMQQGLSANPTYWQKLEQLLKKETAAESCTTIKALQISGGELLQMGLPKGREVGICLQWLLNCVMQNQLPNETNALQQAAMDYIRSHQTSSDSVTG